MECDERVCVYKDAVVIVKFGGIEIGERDFDLYAAEGAQFLSTDTERFRRKRCEAISADDRGIDKNFDSPPEKRYNGNSFEQQRIE